jgi:hypothetical protein
MNKNTEAANEATTVINSPLCLGNGFKQNFSKK